jgi:hypothetical protein
VSAKKLPKNEQVAGAGTSGQGQRLVESEGQQKVPGKLLQVIRLKGTLDLLQNSRKYVLSVRIKLKVMVRKTV